jgi:hypothetical protein
MTDDRDAESQAYGEGLKVGQRAGWGSDWQRTLGVWHRSGASHALRTAYLRGYWHGLCDGHSFAFGPAGEQLYLELSPIEQRWREQWDQRNPVPGHAFRPGAEQPAACATCGTRSSNYVHSRDARSVSPAATGWAYDEPDCSADMGEHVRELEWFDRLEREL